MLIEVLTSAHFLSPDGLFLGDSSGEDYQLAETDDHPHGSPVESVIYAPRIDPVPLPPLSPTDGVGEWASFDRPFVGR